MSAKKNAQIAKFIGELQAKVQAGSISADEAAEFAVTALEEIVPAEEANADQGESAPVADEPAAPAPQSQNESGIDPKSELQRALTTFNSSTHQAWLGLKKKVEDIVRGTSGAAVPLGKVSLGTDNANSHLDIEQKDLASVDCSFYFRQNWSMGGLQLASPQSFAAFASADTACHIPLRKRLLTIAETLSEASAAELTWRSAKLPLRELADIERIARDQNDAKVLSALAAAPSGKEIKEWSAWSTKTEVYLLGSDYVRTEASIKFEDIK